jgi:hypothetical protein
MIGKKPGAAFPPPAKARRGGNTTRRNPQASLQPNRRHFVGALAHQTFWAEFPFRRRFSGLGRRAGGEGELVPAQPLPYVIAYHGVLKAGGTVVNHNTLLVERELVHQIEDSETTIMVTLACARPLSRPGGGAGKRADEMSHVAVRHCPRSRSHVSKKTIGNGIRLTLT